MLRQYRLAVGCVMRLSFGHTNSSTVARLAVASVTVLMLAGCSSDVTRFASDSFSMDPAPTASIPQSAPGIQAGFQPASVGSVDSQPLSPVAAAPLAPADHGYRNARPVGQAVPSAYERPVQASAPRVIPAPAQAQPRAAEKLQFVQGAQPTAAAAPAKVSEAPKAAATRSAEKPLDKPAAKVADKPVAPAVEAPVKQAEKPVAEKPKQMAKLETGAVPAQSAVPSAAAPQAPAAPQAAAEPDSDKPEFRWPARGRIIQGFKAGANEGINIAVPEGTTVKAAEAGVVAYAGNELKGYGNLVLIRHTNGFVSAYANNGEISVKRGETVKRGQAIAKSGQTGNVSSPQLHFELRKGSTPVDPTDFLAGL